jgi:truncated hemoglobin YjbI
MAQLRARQSMFISMLLGGRIVYTSKDIHAAHAHAREQGLNDGHFDRFLGHFREPLNEVGVQADKVEKVTKLLDTRRKAAPESGATDPRPQPNSYVQVGLIPLSGAHLPRRAAG